MHRRCCWPPDSDRPLFLSLSFTSSHSAALPQRLLDSLGHVALEAVEPQAEGDVVEDAHRERVRLLEHHADVAAHGDRIDAPLVDVLAVEVHVALEAEAADRGRSSG